MNPRLSGLMAGNPKRLFGGVLPRTLLDVPDFETAAGSRLEEAGGQRKRFVGNIAELFGKGLTPSMVLDGFAVLVENVDFHERLDFAAHGTFANGDARYRNVLVNDGIEPFADTLDEFADAARRRGRSCLVCQEKYRPFR